MVIYLTAHCHLQQIDTCIEPVDRKGLYGSLGCKHQSTTQIVDSYLRHTVGQRDIILCRVGPEERFCNRYTLNRSGFLYLIGAD